MIDSSVKEIIKETCNSRVKTGGKAAVAHDMQQTLSNLLFLETVAQSGLDVEFELRHLPGTCENAT